MSEQNIIYLLIGVVIGYVIARSPRLRMLGNELVNLAAILIVLFVVLWFLTRYVF